MLAVLLLGLVLGMRHATDADHVVAVTAIVTRHGSVGQAARIGAVWGIGHTLTLLVAGGAIVLLRLELPPRVVLALELAVAVMLITLGARNLGADPAPAAAPAAPLSRPLLVGAVHGLAGSAAVALLVLAAVPDPRWAGLYLLLFAAGTIGGMMAITTAIAAPLALAAGRMGSWRRLVRQTAGVVSIAFGVFLAVRVGIFAGLFSAAPEWFPR